MSSIWDVRRVERRGVIFGNMKLLIPPLAQRRNGVGNVLHLGWTGSACILPPNSKVQWRRRNLMPTLSDITSEYIPRGTLVTTWH